MSPASPASKETNASMTAEKAALRASVESLRRTAHDAGAEVAAQAIRTHFLKSALVPAEGAVIAGYWPFRSEIDPRPLMRALYARGNRIVLPVVVRKAAPLAFRVWGPGAPLVKAGLGGLVPDIGAPELEPDVLLVPMMAFDDAGYRLGYGGGFYDRTLERLRAQRPVRAIGVAYEAQRVAAVPREATDQRLDGILTEAGMHYFAGLNHIESEGR